MILRHFGRGRVHSEARLRGVDTGALGGIWCSAVAQVAFQPRRVGSGVAAGAGFSVTRGRTLAVSAAGGLRPRLVPPRDPPRHRSPPKRPPPGRRRGRRPHRLGVRGEGVRHQGQGLPDAARPAGRPAANGVLGQQPVQHNTTAVGTAPATSSALVTTHTSMRCPTTVTPASSAGERSADLRSPHSTAARHPRHGQGAADLHGVGVPRASAVSKEQAGNVAPVDEPRHRTSG